MFIDEIQNYPEITKIMKYLIDHHSVKFFVTGSASFYMKNLFPESLAGRKFVFQLYPLNFEEFLFFKGVTNELVKTTDINYHEYSQYEYERYDTLFDEYNKYGGFPEVVLTDDLDSKKLILENVFKSFFERDILILSDYQNVKELRDLILLLVPRVGAKLDVTRLSSELGVNRYKIYSYLEFLEAVFIVNTIPIYTKRISKQVVAGKKLYFVDTGILNTIGKISEGQEFENTIANLLRMRGNLSYYQRRSGREIDFILDKKVAFEVKNKATVVDANRLRLIANDLGFDKNYLISKKFAKGISNVLYPSQL